MAKPQSQSFENHSKIVVPYHYLMSIVFLANVLYSLWMLIREPGIGSALGFLVALALIGVYWYMRIFPLTVQDRVIRLEMRLRLLEVLPEEMRQRIGELSTGQLVALRFAGDGELPGLVKTILDEGIRDRKEIKKRIQDWQADHLRC